MAVIGCGGPVGTVAGIPGRRKLVAWCSAVGGAGIVRGAGDCIGAHQAAGALLVGWWSSGVGDWHNCDRQDSGDGAGCPPVPIDAAAIDDYRVVSMVLRARDAPPRGGVRVVGGFGSGEVVAARAGQAQRVGEATLGSCTCMDSEKVILFRVWHCEKGE